ncbi:hypothetical protein AB0B15_42550 [Streptomyces sp. NPDC045456]|uniref:hypothetical protein n=1 Tax=Streptomyces sp. NPDC045456 TaxID=3155254 RepID=UPI003406E160
MRHLRPGCAPITLPRDRCSHKSRPGQRIGVAARVCRPPAAAVAALRAAGKKIEGR